MACISRTREAPALVHPQMAVQPVSEGLGKIDGQVVKQPSIDESLPQGKLGPSDRVLDGWSRLKSPSSPLDSRVCSKKGVVMKKLPDLYRYVQMAKHDGLAVKSTKAGGGWIAVAKACGGENIVTKTDAKNFLSQKFGRQAMPQRLKDANLKSKPKTIKPVITYGDVDPRDGKFLETFAWRKLRMEALIKYGRRCVCCGATPMMGAVMNVDHIKPRKLFPELALDINNLQILCGECNHGKGNWDQTDWRSI